jgi:preprotein translocase subunit SecD
VPTATVILPYRAMDKGATTASYQLGPTALDGKDISTADAVLSQQTNEWEVTLTLTDGGLKKWNTLAADCFSGKSATCPPFGSSTSTTASGSGAVAIVLDSVVISSPVFQTGNFTDNRIQITGGGTGFKEADARNLALILKYGALPVPLEAQAVQTVSATLGKDSLRAGVIAGVVGLLLVFTLMLLYYRALAAVVLVGLCVSASILWFLISWQGAVLTLSGATGVIVSIGVTVDSYVVFFERLKDDVRSGKTLRSSAQRGFASAWRTILAADTVSLIGALLLFWLTVGSVRGFAYYLGLSTLIDIFVAYFFTRPAVRLLSQSKFFSGDKVLGVRKGEAVVGSAQ